MDDWTPFRPDQADLERISAEVAAIPRIQDRLVARNPDLKRRDRAAHQHQIAGGRVELSVLHDLPAPLAGVGIFRPGTGRTGLARISTGLGGPHLETDPNILGLALAFQTDAGNRVDLLAINHPASLTDTHHEFVELLKAAADAAGARPLFGSEAGDLSLPDLIASNARVVRNLIASLGVRKGGRIARHVIAQTLRTARAGTACQPFWTGIVEIGGAPGKFLIAPLADQGELRSLRPGGRHLSEEWRARQAAGPVEFQLLWLRYVDEQKTPTAELTQSWAEKPRPVALLTFPQLDSQRGEARLWGALAAEMGFNPANWIADADETVAEPGTEFEVARKIAYGLSQRARGALPPESYADVFRTGSIAPALAAELRARRAAKLAAGHSDGAEVRASRSA
jgi:hypothetical protein